MRAFHTGVLVLLALCWSSFGAAAGEGRTVIVLDATAQMGAALGQKRKIDWARAAIGASAIRLDPASSLALWSFGSNPQKKCEDKNELAPPQPASAAVKALDKAMAALSPKASRAPAFGALEDALKSAGASDKGPVAAVLIAGTGDDCISDVCGAAGRLHGEYPGAKLTVLGLAMNEKAAAAYTCAAKAMGGAFIAVKSGADLDKNLRQVLGVSQAAPQKASAPPEPAAPAAKAAAAGKAATGESAAASEKAAPAVASAPAPKEQPAPPPAEARPAPKEPQIEPNVVLTAALTPDAPPLDAGVTWEIYKIQTTPTGQTRLAEAPLWTGGGAQAKAKLPEGRYSAKLTYGFASASAEFAVAPPGKVEKTIPLDAGAIAAEALQAAGGAPVEGAFFVLSRAKPGGAREEIGRSSQAPAMFQVNAGEYWLLAIAGQAKIEAQVKAVAGKVSVARIAMNMGALEIKTLAAEGSQKPAPAWHQITPLAPVEAKNAAASIRLFGATQRVQLPAGNYRLESVYGAARAESVVAIAAGQEASKTVILNVGEATVSLPAGKADKICSVYEAGADRNTEPVWRAAGAEMHFFLKAGRYQVECRKKGDAAPCKQAEISVVAGEVQSAKIDD
jgi:hypothetical protein